MKPEGVKPADPVPSPLQALGSSQVSTLTFTSGDPTTGVAMKVKAHGWRTPILTSRPPALGPSPHPLFLSKMNPLCTPHPLSGACSAHWCSAPPLSSRVYSLSFSEAASPGLRGRVRGLTMWIYTGCCCLPAPRFTLLLWFLFPSTQSHSICHHSFSTCL